MRFSVVDLFLLAPLGESSGDPMGSSDSASFSEGTFELLMASASLDCEANGTVVGVAVLLAGLVLDSISFVRVSIFVCLCFCVFLNCV